MKPTLADRLILVSLLGFTGLMAYAWIVNATFDTQTADLEDSVARLLVPLPKPASNSLYSPNDFNVWQLGEPLPRAIIIDKYTDAQLDDPVMKLSPYESGS